jgi:hypothetical protein
MVEKPRFDYMIDVEKIVVEICRRKRDGASGREILQWTRLTRYIRQRDCFSVFLIRNLVDIALHPLQVSTAERGKY